MLRENNLGFYIQARDKVISFEDANLMNIRRIKKIDFDGNIFFDDKVQTRTDMILVKNGDLVISGINVEKGAIALYQGKDDVLATIHYSSYILNKENIDSDFFDCLIRSDYLKTKLIMQRSGGIKTEIKPKDFLKLNVKLPASIEDQKKIVHIYKKNEQKFKNILERFMQLHNSINELYISQIQKIADLDKTMKFRELSQLELISGQDVVKSFQNTRGEGLPYITGASKISDENIILNTWSKYPKKISKIGDLLVSVKGTIGKMAINKIGDAGIGRQIMAIRVKNKPKYSIDYIKFLIETQIDNLKSKAKSQIPGIKRDDLLETNIFDLDIHEQKKIVDRSNNLKSSTRNIIKKIDDVSNEISKLKSSLITKIVESG